MAILPTVRLVKMQIEGVKATTSPPNYGGIWGLTFVKVARLLGFGLILTLYLIWATLLQGHSLPILSRPGGLVSLPLTELRLRDMSKEYSSIDCPCCVRVSSVANQKPYSYLAEEDLPWFTKPPMRLIQLRQHLDARDLVVAFRTILPDPLFGEEENIAVAASYLAGTVVPPGETASLNRIIGPYSKDRGYGEGPTYIGSRIVSTTAGGVCKIASTLYNVIIGANLQLIERHPHSMLVPYVPPGRDATVTWGIKDFRFKNNDKAPVLLWAQSENGILYIAMYGQFTPPSVEWHHKELSRRPTWTVRRPNSQLPKGATRRIPGFDGVSVQTWVTVAYPKKPTERRFLSTDHYQPMPHILEFGP